MKPYYEEEKMEHTDYIAVTGKPSLSRRLWWRLGFGRHDFSSIDEDLEAAKLPGWFRTDVMIYVSFMDRVRLLISGKATMQIENRSNVVVDTVISRSTFWVERPSLRCVG